jgi:hypothetical protein
VVDVTAAAGRPDPSTDPVLVRRAAADRAAKAAKRFGYGCYAVAIVLFLYAYFVDFTSGVAIAIGVLFLVGSIPLIPAIIVGYGVRKATREDPVLQRAATEGDR